MKKSLIDVSPPAPATRVEMESYRFSLDLLPEAAIIFARDGTILKANPRALKAFDADTPEQLLGKKVYSFGTPDPKITEEVVAHIVSGKTIHFELEILTLKRNRRWFDILNVPLLSPTGESERVLGLGRDVTDEHRAAQARDHLAAIVESSDDAIISVSPEFRITSWNRGAERLLGFTADEAIGRLVVDVYTPPRDRAKASAVIAEDLAAARADRGMVRRLEVPLQRKDGSQVDVSLVISGIYDPAGKLLGLSTIVRDMSERRRAERERALLASIVENSDDVIVSHTADFRIISWNQGAEKLLGFTAAEAIGQSAIDLIVPVDWRDRAKALLEQDIAAAREHRAVARRMEVPVQAKDGTRFEVSMVACVLRDSSGQVLGMSVIMRDITERKRAEREQALLASIVNCSDDAIVGFSKDLIITSWNPGAEHIYGYTAAEAIGRGLDLFGAPGEFPLAIAAIRELLRTGEPACFEQPTRRKDGTWFFTLVNAFVVRDAEGKITGGAGIGHNITRLKEIEKDLREARDYTRGLIESSIDAMVVVDRDLRITDGNDQLAKLTETPKKILFGSRFDSYFTDPDAAAAAVNKTLADGFVTDCDLVLRAASGKEVMVSFNASIFYGAGKVFGIFGVARDVTDQRATERTLREEREYSRSLVQCSPDALLVSDSKLIITDVNEQAVQLTGYSREELVGISLASLFIDAGRAVEAMRRSLDQGLVRDVELVLLGRTAEEIPVSLNISVYKDSDGSVRGTLVAVRDVSERKRYEKERSLLASIVDSSADAIYAVTQDLTITSWNAAAEKLFGYSAAEVIGRNAVLLVPLDRRAELADHHERLRQTGASESFETARLRKDGSIVEVSITWSPVFDALKKLAAISVTAHDISERKRIEAELMKAHDSALESGRLKSEFLANMSHEIRTPLNSIIGMTGLLLDTGLNAEQREFALDVRESGETLLTLINEILDFSKIAAGKVAFEELDFELTRTVESAVELIADQARRKGLELTVSVDPEAPQFLRGDSGRLRQVLVNLIGNAIKFTEHGEITVQVNKLSENPRETILRFEVRDTGIGIPKEKQHLLFEPFTQVDASTTRHFGGTGLGLSISRQLVEQMGGRIAVSSTPGVGSTFWFTAKFAKQIDISKPASERFASLTGVRILIVDDNPNSREILRRQVTSWGMQAATAGSAEEAMRMMRGAGQPYQAALLDVMMPEVDGIALAHSIKRDPALANTGIIFISSVGARHDFHARLRGLDDGGWLMKPVPQSILYNSLIRMLPSVGATAIEGEPAARNGASAMPTLPAKTLMPSANRKLRALVAEDNPINQKLARLQLKKLGLDTDAVANGREAVDAASRFSYDVVLMDCQMPDLDGYDATREIRRREGSKRHTKIVAMTAHALPGDRDKCLEAGMDGYISKPVEVEALEKVLAEVLSAQTSQPLDTAPPPPALPVTDGPPGNDVVESAPPAPIDAQAITALRHEGGDLLEELIGIFLEETRKGLSQLDQALAQNDLKTVAFQAHRLKGSGASFGAKPMCDLCQALEQAAKAGDLPRSQALLKELAPECNRVCEALEAERRWPP